MTIPEPQNFKTACTPTQDYAAYSTGAALGRIPKTTVSRTPFSPFLFSAPLRKPVSRTPKWPHKGKENQLAGPMLSPSSPFTFLLLYVSSLFTVLLLSLSLYFPFHL